MDHLLSHGTQIPSPKKLMLHQPEPRFRAFHLRKAALRSSAPQRALLDDVWLMTAGMEMRSSICSFSSQRGAADSLVFMAQLKISALKQAIIPPIQLPNLMSSTLFSSPLPLLFSPVCAYLSLPFFLPPLRSCGSH